MASLSRQGRPASVMVLEYSEEARLVADTVHIVRMSWRGFHLYDLLCNLLIVHVREATDEIIGASVKVKKASLIVRHETTGKVSQSKENRKA